MHCDLHTHSHFSDGSFSPSEIIEQAKQQDLIVALTDHNTVAGLSEFTAQAQKLGVTAVPGIELSTVWEETELHVLGLFIAPEYYSEIERITKNFRIKKEISNRESVQRLQAAGYAIDYDEICRRTPGGNINRAHIAAALYEKGCVTSISRAFDRLLKPGQGFYEPPERLSFFDAIGILSRIHALPILAHPLKDLDETRLRAVLPDAIQAGLVGMEAWHSSYHREQERLAAQIAGEYRLLACGGSDFHGENKPGIELNGCHIPAYVYHDLLRYRTR